MGKTFLISKPRFIDSFVERDGFSPSAKAGTEKIKGATIAAAARKALKAGVLGKTGIGLNL